MPVLAGSETHPIGVMSKSTAILFSQRPAGRGMMMTTAAGQGWEAPLQRTAGTIAREVPPSHVLQGLLSF